MPLQGRLILDCSTLFPGPLIGKLLAKKGARVIKIENPDRPDPARVLNPVYFSDLNECKEELQLNLTRPQDRLQFEKWVLQADGIIEGFRPSAKLKLGLDEKSLHLINSRVCIASLVGFPENGPLKDRAGHDLNFGALTGLISLFKEMPAIPLAELFGAYEAALSLVCAMDSAYRTGRGSRVVISLTEALTQIQSRLIREYQATGILPKPGETLFSGVYPCYRLYHSAEDRRISVGAIEAKFWQKICSQLGHPELSSEGYAVGKRGEEVIATIQSAFSSRPWAHWAPIFLEADCCVEPVLDYSEVFRRGL